jgi:DNA-binding HxlR family transcriptional regulator
MKRRDVKSSCPINYTLEIFGDPWSLLIVRGMLVSGRKTFTEFLDADERIGTRTLAERLVHLEKNGIIQRHLDSKDKRKINYSLTETGRQLIPTLYEISVWGTRTSPKVEASQAWFKAMSLDKEPVIEAWYQAVRTGSSFMYGPTSVVAQLELGGEYE